MEPRIQPILTDPALVAAINERRALNGWKLLDGEAE